MNEATNRKITIVGPGRLGGALALALSRNGYPIESLIGGEPSKAAALAREIEPRPSVLAAADAAPVTSRLVLVATQDFAIAPAVEQLRGRLTGAGQIVLHTSGSLSSDVLRPLRELGCRTGSLHPLVAVSDPRLGAERFRDSYFCLEGEPEAVAEAETLVHLLGGKSFSIATRHKTLYHAAAVTASGHLVALVDTALEMLTGCGLSEPDARATLWPLIASTVENLRTQTPAAALTGTFARADVGTFERHLDALGANVSDEARAIYLQLGARSAHLAAAQGANPDNLEEILRQISLAKKSQVLKYLHAN